MGEGAVQRGCGAEKKELKEEARSQVWLCTLVVPALRRPRQGHHEFETSLSSMVRLCLKKTHKNRKARNPFISWASK
jgi:hypothetical protein